MAREQRYEQLIDALHASPWRLVYVFAGAGSRALWWLHRRPGSSRTLLEARDLYCAASMDDFLGATPAKYASAATAGAMATAARVRARALRAAGPVAGLALTATIATDRTKRGAHRVAVGLDTGGQQQVWQLELEKGARDREGEETVCAELLLRALADALELPAPPPLEAAPELLPAESRVLSLRGGKAGLAVLPGSFDPLHEGHLALARVAGERLGLPVVFELSAVHPVKGPLAPEEVARRAAQFAPGELLVTQDPLYLDKARALPGAVFVVGVDTARRILDPRFYEDREAVLTEISALGCRFLVAGRATDGGFDDAGALAPPPGFEALFEPIPETLFRIDISSTELRGR